MATPNPSPTSLYLGVDGGGTKTLAVIVNGQGEELARGQAGSSNIAALGLETATRNIFLAVEQAKALLQIPDPITIKKAWLGLAGFERKRGDHERVFPLVQSLADDVLITNDSELLLSALDGAIGIALVAGTGSIAMGRDHNGKVRRAGGWGHVMGDEGSGFELGRQALHAATRAADGRGPQTLLLDLILRYWKLDTPDDIISFVYPFSEKHIIADLSRCVFEAAEAGDTVAQQILDTAAAELALAVAALGRQLDFPEKRLPLALAGSLLVRQEHFREQMLTHLRKEFTIEPVAIVKEPGVSAARATITMGPASDWNAL